LTFRLYTIQSPLNSVFQLIIGILWEQSSTMAQSNDSSASHTDYVAYRTSTGQNRIGSLVLETSKVQPLAFKSGAPISDLYQVIEVGESHIKPSGDTIDLASVTLLPPISGRDVLAVGKNYADHAKGKSISYINIRGNRL
jgi:hypothetical protein